MRIFRLFKVHTSTYHGLFCCVLLTIVSFYSVSRAEMTPRLAVLELQGDVGTLQQRQFWSDTIRAASLEALYGYQVSVIDRDQFLMLIQPGRDLSACIGMCAAQIAREVGARWSLSGQLLDQRRQFSVTLKVHSASGDLLGVEQVLIPRTQLTKRLALLTKKLILRTLLAGAEDQEDRSADDVDDTDDVDEDVFPDHDGKHETSTGTQPMSRSQSQMTVGSDQVSARTMIERQGRRGCAGPLVTQKSYRSCVEAGHCTASASWGKCQSKDQEPIVCTSIQQALQFAMWSGGRLPSIKDLLALSKEPTWVHARPAINSSLSEWTLPVEHPEEQILWSKRISTLDVKDLRTESKVPVWQFSQGKALSRMVPPAFQTTHISFRVVYPETHCYGDESVK